MPNTTVPATAEGMPKFNRAAIMSDAWSIRRDKLARSGWQVAKGIVDASFRTCLKTAWRKAKEAAAAAVRALKVARVLAGPHGARLTALMNALEQVQYLSFRFRAFDERKALQAEIDALLEGEAA